MTSPNPASEVELPWKLIVESDQIYSTRTGKWYEVRGVVKQKTDGRIRVFAKGIPKAFTRDPDDFTKVRRGVTGEAVDVFQIIFSGQTARDIPESERL